MLNLILWFLLYPSIGYNDAANIVNGKPLLKVSAAVDTLPDVLPAGTADLLQNRLRNLAVLKFGIHQLPGKITEWNVEKQRLKKLIIEKAGVVIDHTLPLDIREKGTINLKGYSIKNIAFQTKPGIYATANLYIPEGKGPFPAVINMLGHWRKGKGELDGPQPVGHSLALDGYVCLSIDPWGSGERTTKHGDFEYHGGNLGASLMNIGETLAGVQITDNMRGIDLLSSLPYVNSKNIGATGASGGGNQTMWLAVIDERVKVAMPVVSVGTFESYIMRSNCICELLPDGLTFTEEAGVLAMVAPRALKMCNHSRDLSPTFFPAEMIRTYNNAKQVYKMMGVEKNIDNQVIDQTHGYWPEDREALLGWFDLHLKGIGDGSPKKEKVFEQLPHEKLLLYPSGERESEIMTTDRYCKSRGEVLRSAFLSERSVDPLIKRRELRKILRLDDKPLSYKVHKYSGISGWDRLALETSEKKLIPLLHKAPAKPQAGYVIICDSDGKKNIKQVLLNEYINKGMGVVLIDLSGTGEAGPKELPKDKGMVHHTLARSQLWLGKTIMGEWVNEIGTVIDLLKTRYKAAKIGIDGNKEAGLAGLFLSATDGKGDYLILRDAPVSYLFDNRENVDFYNMAIHLPGFLNWGDVSLATALTGKPVTMLRPLTMSGSAIEADNLKEFQVEFQKVRKLTGLAGETTFK